MLSIKITDDGLMIVNKEDNLCRFISKETDNQILNNSRAELEKLISGYAKTLSASGYLQSLSESGYVKTLSESGFLQSLPEYVAKGEHILKSEYDRLFKSITHYPVSHNRFYNPKKSKKQKQKEKIDRLEKELKEAREVIYSQALTINRLESKELILIEHQPTVLITGRKSGTVVYNETKELLYAFWVKQGCQGSGEFASTMKRKLDNKEPVDGLLLVFDDNLPYTSKSEAIAYKAEFSKVKPMLFSGLPTVLTEFKKKFEQESKEVKR
jgi:hypothetical protein